MQDATEWKTQGNQAFTKGRIEEAISCYSSGIAAAADAENAAALQAVLLSNRAMCHLKQGEFRRTIDDCCTAHELLTSSGTTDQNLRVKLWFRRAKAWLNMAQLNMLAPEYLEEAEFDLDALLKEDPDNKDAKDLLKEVREQQEKNPDRKPAAVEAEPQRVWQCWDCIAQPKFTSHDEFAAHRDECQENQAKLLQRLASTRIQQRSREADTPNETDSGALFDFDDMSDDDSFDIKNCRLCGKTPEEAGHNIMKVCAKCKSVSYCCREHQVEDWPKHRKDCKFLSNDNKWLHGLSKAEEGCMSFPGFREMLETQKAAGLIDPEPLDSERGAFRLNEFIGAMQGEEQLKYLLRKYKDLANDDIKLARKLLKAIRDYPDRASLHTYIMFYLFDKLIGMQRSDPNRTEDVSLWKACYSSPIMTERLFDTVRVIMETDIRRLQQLKPGMSDTDLQTKPLAWCVIPQCLEDPVTASFHAGAIRLFFSSCWMQHLDLSLATWQAIRLGFTDPLDSLMITSWAVSAQLLRLPSFATDVFEGAQRADGKPFHAADSPTLNRFLELMDIQGDTDLLSKFKHNIYCVAALLVLNAKTAVSAKELDAAITIHLDRPPNRRRAAFFKTVTFSFAKEAIDQGLSAELDFGHVMKNHPEYKRML